MPVGAEELAQAVRLAGATLVGVALCRAMLGEDRPAPFRIALAGTTALLIGGATLLVATVAPFAERLEEPLAALALEYLERSTHGRLLFAPVLPAIHGLLVLAMMRSAETQLHRQVLCGLLGVTVLGIAWLLAIGGHAVMEEGQGMSTLAHVLHVTTALAWAALVTALMPRLRGEDALTRALHRFGNPALMLVALLVTCGLLTAWTRGVRMDSIADDRYGALLLAKSALLTLALGAAAWNRYFVLSSGEKDARRARRVLAIETGLLGAIVLLAAALSRTPPPT